MSRLFLKMPLQLAFLAFVAWIALPLHAREQPEPESTAPRNIQADVPETLKTQMLERLDAAEARYDQRWNWYRLLYFTFTLVPAFLSALAGLLPTLKPISADDPDEKRRKAKRENISLVLGMVAAFIMVVSTAAGFNKVASANRLARDAVRTSKKDVRDNKISSMAVIDTKLDDIEAEKSRIANSP